MRCTSRPGRPAGSLVTTMLYRSSAVIAREVDAAAFGTCCSWSKPTHVLDRLLGLIAKIAASSPACTVAWQSGKDLRDPYRHPSVRHDRAERVAASVPVLPLDPIEPDPGNGGSPQADSWARALRRRRPGSCSTSANGDGDAPRPEPGAGAGVTSSCSASRLRLAPRLPTATCTAGSSPDRNSRTLSNLWPRHLLPTLTYARMRAIHRP